MPNNSDGSIVLSVSIDSSEVSSDMKKVVSEINKQVQAEAKNVKAVESVNQAKEKTAQAQQKTEQAVYKTLQAESQALTAEQNLTTAKEKTAQEVAKTEAAIYKSLEAEQKAVNAEQALQTEKAKTAQAETQAETAEIRKFQAAVQTVTAIQNQNTAAEKTAQAIEKTKQEQEKTLQSFEKTTQSQQKTIQEQQKILLNEEKIKQAKEKTTQAEEKTKQAIIKTEKAQNSLKKATDSITNAVKKMASILGIAFSVKQLINFSNEASELASQTEAYLTRMSMLYGESVQDVYDWANANAYALGMAKSTAYEAAAQYGNLFTTFASAQESAKLSIDMLQTTAVVASQTGRTYEETFEKIQSGIYGNTRAIDDLGISVRQSSLMQTQAWNTVSQNGAKTWNDLTDAELQQLRVLGIIEQSTAKYGNTVMQTTALTRAQFNAAWTDFKAAWGQVINVVLMPIMKVATQILTYITNGLNGLLKIFGKELTYVEDKSNSLKDNINGASEAQEDLAKNTKKAKKEADRLVASFDELQFLGSKTESETTTTGSTTLGTTTPKSDETNGYYTLKDTEPLKLSKKLQKSLEKIKDLVIKIGAAFAAWIIAKGILKTINWLSQKISILNKNSVIKFDFIFTGLNFLSDLNSLIYYIDNINENGLTFYNSCGIISSGLGLIGNALILMGSPKIGSGLLAISGLIEFLGSIQNMIENGIDFENVSSAIRGVSSIGIALGYFIGGDLGSKISGISLTIKGIMDCVREISEHWEEIKNGDWSGVDKTTLIVGVITALAGIAKTLNLFNSIKKPNSEKISDTISETSISIETVSENATPLSSTTKSLTKTMTKLAKNIGIGILILAEVAIGVGLFVAAIWGLGLLLQQVIKAWKPVIKNSSTVNWAILQGGALLVIIGAACAGIGYLTVSTGGTIALAIGAGMLVLAEIGLAAAEFIAELIIIGIELQKIIVTWSPILKDGKTVDNSIKKGTELLLAIGGATAALGAASIASIGLLPLAIKLGTDLLDDLTEALIRFCDDIIKVSYQLRTRLYPELKTLSIDLPDIKDKMNEYTYFMKLFCQEVVNITKQDAISGLSATVDKIIKFFLADPIDNLYNNIKDQTNGFKKLNPALDTIIEQLMLARYKIYRYKYYMGAFKKESELSKDSMFGSIVDGGEKAVNTLIGYFETMANSVVICLNKIGQSLNDFSFEMPDWIPDYGGKKFKFNISKINEISIPRLAKGAVIPANHEFLAVLGDQKRGTNIEAPLDTIVQAMNIALQNNPQSGDVVIEANGDTDSIIKFFDFQIKRRQRLVGDTI